MTEKLTKNTTILVVDDSPNSLGMLNMALSEAGYTVLVSLDGQQALSILGKVIPDVVLLDAMMPGMDGFDTCKKIKQNFPDIPVIFMTGLTEVEHIVAGFNAGGVDYVTKPIKPEEVIARARVHIANARKTISARAALDSTGQHIFSVDSLGNILWSTQQAQDFFESITTSGKDNQAFTRFTRELEKWLNQSNERNDLLFQEFIEPIKVIYIGKQSEFDHLVKISLQHIEPTSDQLIKKLPITKREADVLLWISLGKSNWEIAKILKISPRTVNKHLEQIYRKLEVDNRTSAAAAAINILNNNYQ